MKHILTLFLLLYCAFATFGQTSTGNHLILKPSQPVQGQEIGFTYNHIGTGLEDATEINAVAFVYTPKEDVYHLDYVKAYDVPLQKGKDGWEGKIKPVAGAHVLYVKFYQKNITDSNKGEGYSIFLTDKDKQIIPEARLSKADMLAGKGFLLGIEPNYSKALTLFKDEFEKSPQLKRPYLELYTNMLYMSEAANVNEIANVDKLVREEISWLKDQPNLTDNELQLLITLHRRLYETKKADELVQELHKRNPKHNFFSYELTDAYRKEKDAAKQDAILKTMAADFPKNNFVLYTYRKKATSYAKEKDIAGFKSMLQNHPAANSEEVYKAFADALIESGTNLRDAEEFAAKAYTLAKKELYSPKSPRMTLLSEKEWLKRKENILATSAITYGKVLVKKEDYEKALPLLKEAYSLTQENNNAVIEEYTAALQKSGDYKSARQILENRIADAKGTDKMKAFLKHGFLKEKELAEVDSYMANIEGTGMELLKQELSKKMLTADAPSFSLLDLNGKKVSLASLKGKTVVLDFWATWCRPCIAAFPAMQRAVEAYKNDKEVVFLFINTLEDGKDKKKKVGELIKKKGYAFQVLMDEKNKMAQDYGAASIPVKFVIDGNGKIRFRSEGFDGNVDKAEKELRVMVELVRQEQEIGVIKK